MSEPFIGELRCFGFNFPPRGWAQCDGQLLGIAQFSALFSLLGTMYGGDAQTTFGLPDLRGRSAIHKGQGPGLPNFAQGSRSGSVSTTLSVANIPSHSHSMTLKATNNNASSTGPGGRSLAVAREDTYGTLNGKSEVDMQGGSVVAGNTGGGQSFNNMPPYITLNWCIALIGIFPSR